MKRRPDAVVSGAPCSACGSTERYKKDGRCAPCRRKKASAWASGLPDSRRFCRCGRETRTRRSLGLETCYPCRNTPEARRQKEKARRGGGIRTLRECGLSEVQARAILASADSCEICGRDRLLVVDHDHGSGKFRGVLCSPCNQAIGVLGDDADGVARALVYL